MSGPLRRNQRSRPADAGEPHQEGQAAESEGAAPTADTPPAAPESGADPVTERLAREPETAPRAEAAADESAGATTPDATGADESARATTPDATTAAEESAPAATPPERSRRRLFGRRRKHARADGPIAPAPAAPAPVLLADPGRPAGVDPAEAPLRPPAGRRGRLRRRLRYLRRARELMLRDLGGLLYEVHRTGGGNVEAHATVVGAKVQRIAGLDAEAHALETALTAPRGETVVFEPGVGGTCADVRRAVRQRRALLLELRRGRRNGRAGAAPGARGDQPGRRRAGTAGVLAPGRSRAGARAREDRRDRGPAPGVR